MSQLTPAQLEYIARATHEVNRSWCQLIGDNSQPAWADAPEWQKTSAINGVLSVTRGEHAAQKSHESWLAEKRATGWTYGPVKDSAAKTHPCMVEYDRLPFEQQQKDHLFVATARALAENLWKVPQ